MPNDNVYRAIAAVTRVRVAVERAREMGFILYMTARGLRTALGWHAEDLARRVRGVR